MACVNCCELLECLEIGSSDNSISVQKTDCGYDLKFLANNINNFFEIQEGDCISFQKEFYKGKLILKPVIDYDCLAEKICGLCTPAVCMPPDNLTVEII